MTNYNQKWEEALAVIREGLADNVSEFNDWFRPIVFETFIAEQKKIILQVPGRSFIERIEKNHMALIASAFIKAFGKGVTLGYRVTVAQTPILEESEHELIKKRDSRQQTKTPELPEVDSQLDPHMNFNNFIEGDSNRLSRSVGIHVAEHPRGTKFNPMFIYGPSGCGKTHLINAIGVRTKEIYPQKRVLYVSARTFEHQYTSAVPLNKVNDFIGFYQTIDVLIVDDIHEWIGKERTQDTFFHIFDYLFRQQKRIVLACDRSPAQLKGMHERLITRFKCGVTCEVLKPNTQLCRDILKNKISRDGLTISDDVIQYIAENVNGSVRDLQGVINSLMVYSIVENSDIDTKLAERIIKKVVKADDEPISIDIITDCVCENFNVTPQDIYGKSRKKEIATARHIAIYLTQTMTSMQTTRIGRLFGGRDHSTVLNSVRKAERMINEDKDLRALVIKIEKEIRERQ